MVRSSLEKYFGCQVWIEGEYDGSPIGHEKPVTYKSGSLLSANEISKEKVQPSDEQPRLLKPMMRIDQASCIIKVKGTRGFEDIHETHINLQVNITESKIQKGDLVEIHGEVTKYKNNYAIRPDYWIKIEE